MPKTDLIYKEQCNFLNVAGTIRKLVAISYYKGGKGRYADPARNFITDGIRRFEEGLSEKDRKRYLEILDNLNLADNLKD